MLLTAVMALSLKSHFETTINMKQNNLTFGRTIHLKKKKWADCLPEKHYAARL
jgi:hypothetical protein